MEQIKTTEKKVLGNGHVIVSYQLKGYTFYDEYPSLELANKGDKKDICSRHYEKKDANGNIILNFINPLNQNQRIKTLFFNKNLLLFKGIYFDSNSKKQCVKHYNAGILMQSWTYNPNTDKIDKGLYYEKEENGNYFITHISYPIYNKTGELSHFVTYQTTPEGKNTNEITERIFYLQGKPSIKLNYIKSANTKNKTVIRISTMENGRWVTITDNNIKEKLKPVLKELIALESKTQNSNNVLQKNSNLTFDELYYSDVIAFKSTHPSLKVYTPEQTNNLVQLIESIQ